MLTTNRPHAARVSRIPPSIARSTCCASLARGAAALLVALCGLTLSACKSNKSAASSASAPDEVNSGLSALAADSSPQEQGNLAALVDQASIDLAQVLASRDEANQDQGSAEQKLANSAPNRSKRPGAAMAGETNPSEPAPSSPLSTSLASRQSNASTRDQASAEPSQDDPAPSDFEGSGLGVLNASLPETRSTVKTADANGGSAERAKSLASESEALKPDLTPAQRMTKAVDEIARQFSERASESEAWNEHVVAGALSTLLPNGVWNLRSSMLSPAEREGVDAVRALLGSLKAGPASSGEPAAVLLAFSDASAKLREQASPAITAAALCTRVTGYGRYQPMRPAVFQSGQPARAILYTEVENLGHREVRDADPDAMPGDRWAVDVTQELELRLSNDPTLQWRQSEQRVIETGRNKRRDFFLVQELNLPSTLSAGTYELKITLRDIAKGGDDRIAEIVLPLAISGDAKSAKARE
ncbi:MAG: hypothetical protein SFZ23_03170 [Planctomycetota bacterium]|nr:hypothetical protein [Planctomycetota bacterium]